VRRRWSRSSRVYLAVSVALAAAAGLLVRDYVARAGAAELVAGPRVAVVVAARDVARGSILTTSQLRIVRIPAAFVPPRALSRVEQAAGRAALTDLASGEAVTQTRLARVRAGPVASLVPQGLRAFAVPTSLPPGALQPGDRVDVLATFGTAGAGQPHTETVVEGVEVLFVLGEGAPAGGGSPLSLDVAGAEAGGSVTLIVLVAPDQESRLAYARAFADLEVGIAPAAGGP
jgi:pilus assembly protein CpaB